ncbi:MAG: benzoate/H(+) symporter BenE family transporter [Pseudomonadota bacterium]
MRASLITSAFVAVLVGFGGSVAVVIAATEAVGASPAETSSWIAALCVAMAIGSLSLSVWYRMPIVLAWSTPGAALIAASSGIGLPEAVGAFLVAGALIALTGLIQPLGDLVRRIPTAIATALLAGVLFDFVAGAALKTAALPQLGLPMVVTFLIVRLWSPAWAVIAALVAGVTVALVTGTHDAFQPLALSDMHVIAPVFDPGTLIGLALPLYIVTMASQNLPGFAVLRADGYEPPVAGTLLTTGGLSVLTAPFGAHTTSLAAITAAICTGRDAHPDPSERWKGGIFYAAGYALLAPVAASVVAAANSFPDALIVVLAGLALLGPFVASLRSAFSTAEDSFPAAMTFVITASGMSFFSVGAPFWGLCIGILCLGMAAAAEKQRREAQSS